MSKTIKRIVICVITGPIVLIIGVLYVFVWVAKNAAWAWGGDDNEWDGK